LDLPPILSKLIVVEKDTMEEVLLQDQVRLQVKISKMFNMLLGSSSRTSSSGGSNNSSSSAASGDITWIIIIIVIVGIVILAAAGVGGYFLLKKLRANDAAQDVELSDMN
jgi:hypothetical protein